MKIIYAGEEVVKAEEFPPAIFLAGPTPRGSDPPSWRPRAIELIKSFGWSGYVYVPEPEQGPTGKWLPWKLQVDWEHKMLFTATCIAFWVPSEKDLMPGLTTRVEAGMFCMAANNRPNVRTVFGAPEEAYEARYMRYCFEKFNPGQDTYKFTTLEDTMKAAVMGDESGW